MIFTAGLLMYFQGAQFTAAGSPVPHRIGKRAGPNGTTVAPAPHEKVKTAGPNDFKGGRVWGGIVTVLGKDGLWVKGLVDQPYAPKRVRKELYLPFSQCLRNGKFSSAVAGAAAQSYLPAHLQVGDIVILDFQRDDGKDRCTSIMICKRPGGRVPPSPNFESDKFQAKLCGYRYHEYANAKQDLEERGIPLPERFKPKPVPQVPSLEENERASKPMPVKPIPLAKP